jgi:uncharacterized protein (TIGR00266 family)
MNYEVKYSPAYALAVISLETGEQIQAETGAMVSMSDAIQVKTGMQGGLFAGLKRSVLGGESLFINTFTADAPGEITVAPALPGDVVTFQLNNETMFLQSGSFLAATPGVTVDTKWGGGRTFFSREGLFLLKCTGSGTIFASSYGAIHLVELADGQRYTVDTGHMVAFDESVRYEVGRAGGWKTTIMGGEGLVCKLTGPGRFFLQTRSPEGFLSWLTPKLPGRRE